jgi:hypothetical protein
LVQSAIATLAQKFTVKLGQPCQWHTTTAPGIIEAARWYFADYLDNDVFYDDNESFKPDFRKAALDLKYACEKSGDQYGPAIFAGPGAGGHSYVVCSYYPKK